MAWSRLQSAVSASAGAAVTSVGQAFTTANLSSGTTVIALVSISSVTVSGITGVGLTCGGTTMVLIKQATSGSAGAEDVLALYALNTPAGQVGTKPTVTASWTNNGNGSLLIQEVSGLALGATLAALADGTPNQNTGSGGTSAAQGAYSSTALNEYLVACYGDDGGTGAYTVPPGYTGDANNVGGTNGAANVGLSYKNSTNGAESGTYTLSGSPGQWATIIVAFKLAASAGVAGKVQPVATRPLPRRTVQRARIGAAGLCAAGLLGTITPAGHTPPLAGVHTAPGRGPSRAHLGAQGLPGTGNPGPFTNRLRITPQPHPPLPRSPAPRRAQAGPSGLPGAGIAGPGNATVTFAAVGPPAWHPQPRPRPGGRGIARGSLGLLNHGAAPPPRQLTQPRRGPGARALWRGISGTVLAVPGVAVAAPKQLTQPRRPPGARGLWRGIVGSANAAPVTPPFPQVPIDLDVDLLLNGWTEISPYVYQRDQNTPLTISRGTPDEFVQAAPSSATMQLNNRDRRFSARNPTGAYFGLLGRNTPLRASVPAALNALRMEDDQVSWASCPSTSALNLAGDLEARIDVALSNWTATTLAAKWSLGSFSWAWLLNADGTLAFQYSTDGSTVQSARSSQPLPWPGGRISLKVTYNHTTGATAFWWATSIGGTYTQIGATVTGTGTGALFAIPAVLAVGYSSYHASLFGYLDTTGGVNGNVWSPAAYGGMTGLVYEFQLRNGIGGALAADPVFSGQTAGTASFADAQANTWTLNGTAGISGRQYRYHGEVAEWPPRQDPSGTDVWMPVTASGLLRRLAAGNAPLDSAMTRAWQRKTGTYAPVAYWPGEDGNNATATTLGLAVASSSVPDRITSGLAAGTAMTLSGKASTFASSSTFACSNALPVPGTGTWTGRVKGYTLPASPAVVFRFLLAAPSGGDTNNAVLARVYCGGTCTRMDLQYGTVNSGSLQLIGYDNTGTQLFASGFVQFRVNGQPCMVEMALTVSGGTVTWHVNTLNVGASSQLGLSNTFAGSIGAASTVVINPNGVQVSSAIGQMAVQNAYAFMDSPVSADSLIGPLNAWAQESAAARVARLCGEQGFACRILGNPASSVVLGPQTPQTFVSLLQEAALADHGLLFEPRGSLSIGYRCSMTLASQAAGISGTLPVQIDYSQAMLGDGTTGIEPVDDDQLTRNDEIVTRGTSSVTGASYEVTMTAAQFAATQALSISPPPGGVGLYQNSSTVNVLGDNQLGDQAGWIVHLGTVNELRFPVIPVSLARPAVAGISAQLQALDLGDYLQILNPPADYGPDTIKAIIFGAKEVVGGYKWELQWQTQPESPWEVLTAGSGALTDPRADTDGSTLTAGYTSSAVSLSVATSAGAPLWTTVAGDFPFDIAVAGERMTVTAITGTTSPQTFTVTRSVNGVVKAQLSGAAVSLFAPVYFALA